MLLITGAKGQLGTELSKLLPDAIVSDVSDLDITDKTAVNTYVKEHNVDTIINCAAYTAVDKAEADTELANKINVIGPKNLAQSGAKIIHISTDYVFDGTSYRPYSETDTPHPVSVYGKTKLAGERAVLDNAKSAIIIRTAWLYSPYGNNFVKTMRRLGAEKSSLRVVCDQVGTPTYAGDLAQAIVDILPQFKEGHRGVYHFSNQGVCSWYDFAVEIMKQSGLSCQVMPIETRDYPTAATRPFYSVLNKSKIIAEFNVNIPHWKESLEKCLKQF
ncbi:MAG: dTDP-4-dehydrorhamnose reductase [Alphaproteobacteria bacterium]|nr:dTDP-4-dehydrorhamnose reductase [Alphaproteobacteria bacterium]MBQ7285884.1 dTDP-4-dehydrorhamnose reductase [Alphaproteobacteria bacterium]